MSLLEIFLNILDQISNTSMAKNLFYRLIILDLCLTLLPCFLIHRICTKFWPPKDMSGRIFGVRTAHVVIGVSYPHFKNVCRLPRLPAHPCAIHRTVVVRVRADNYLRFVNLIASPLNSSCEISETNTKTNTTGPIH